MRQPPELDDADFFVFVPRITGNRTRFQVRLCTPDDFERMYAIINAAARAYQGVIPDDCYHEPYMPREELSAEMGKMTFYGWDVEGTLLGVMGFQPLGEVTLVRHAYVDPPHQRQGIGSLLLRHLKDRATAPRLLVGTWANASWAIAFYEKHGFRLLPDGDDLLRTYWDIPDHQREASVVLGLELTRH